MSLKNSNDTNGNRTRDLTVYSVVHSHMVWIKKECREEIVFGCQKDFSYISMAVIQFP